MDKTSQKFDKKYGFDYNWYEGFILKNQPMKQKRKENCSLHSSKQCLNAIGTVTLLGVVCGVLGIISVGLITKSAMAVGGDGNTSTVAYTGVDDKIDVVVGLNFIDQINQSKDLYNFYESGDNLYVTPNNVVVNVTNTNGEIVKNNEVIGSVYGHVLGGEGNKLNSDNVTIIAGSSNEIGAGNTNAVLLGGTGNTMGGSEVLALVGGEGNDANKKDGLIIGGNNNTVNGGNGSASVLGGERNEVLGDNAVVGGLGIRMAQSLKNVFAYSNRNVGAGNFITKSSDAFYLDIKSGLGINLESTKGGVEMQGAMGFGEVDINQGCNDSSNNYGVQGTWNGCMVGCTKAGGGKWQLLDSSESCKTKCEDNNSRCVVDVYNPTSVAGRCADSTVSTMHTTKCGTSGSYEQYKNAIFEVTLVDQGKCPANSENLGNNQCVYACDSGSHLVEDKTGKVSDARNGKGCYQDCTLDGVTKKHNETMDAYKSDNVYCANDAGSPASTVTCGNNGNKATLMCVDGTFYTVENNKPKDINTVYLKSSCTLHEYKCDTNTYNLRASDITSGTYKEKSEDMTWNTTDRGKSEGKRGIYQLCIDFDGQSVTKSNNTCKQKSDPYHYRLVGCQDRYERYSSVTNKPDPNGDQCREKCTWGSQPYLNGKTLSLYVASNPSCPTNCGETKTFTCNDGSWGNTNGYTSTTCSVKTKSCEGYNIRGELLKNLEKAGIRGGTIYEECSGYTSSEGGHKCSGFKKYKFVGCADGYDTVENSENSYNGVILGPSVDNSGNKKYCLPVSGPDPDIEPECGDDKFEPSCTDGVDPSNVDKSTDPMTWNCGSTECELPNPKPYSKTECDFDFIDCTEGGTVISRTKTPNGCQWVCSNGKNNNVSCGLFWNSQSSEGSCQLNTYGGECGGMYVRWKEYGKAECESAGAIQTYYAYGGISGRWTCYFPNSVDGTNGANGGIEEISYGGDNEPMCYDACKGGKIGGGYNNDTCSITKCLKWVDGTTSSVCKARQDSNTWTTNDYYCEGITDRCSTITTPTKTTPTTPDPTSTPTTDDEDDDTPTCNIKKAGFGEACCETTKCTYEGTSCMGGRCCECTGTGKCGKHSKGKCDGCECIAQP